MFRAKVGENIKTHILCSINCFRQSWRLCDNVKEYCTAGQTTNNNGAQTHCMMVN